jgi:hypothetical protein
MNFVGAKYFDKNGFAFWFKVNGYGLSVTDSKPMFSERNGYRKNFIRIFGIKFELMLPKEK